MAAEARSQSQSAQLLLKQHARERAAQKRRAENKKQVAALDQAVAEQKLPFNAMDEKTTPEQVQAKLEELLGQDLDRNIAESFRPLRSFRHLPSPAPARALPNPKDGEARVRAAKAKAEGKKFTAITIRPYGTGDVTGLDGEAYQALLRARGLQAPGSTWSPTRSPSRR